MSFLAEQPVSAYRDTASGRAGSYNLAEEEAGFE